MCNYQYIEIESKTTQSKLQIEWNDGYDDVLEKYLFITDCKTGNSRKNDNNWKE